MVCKIQWIKMHSETIKFLGSNIILEPVVCLCKVEVDAADSSKTLVSDRLHGVLPIITTKGTAYQETPTAIREPSLSAATLESKMKMKLQY